MTENKNAKTPADGPEYERGFVDGMQRQMQLHVNRVIKEEPLYWNVAHGWVYANDTSQVGTSKEVNWAPIYTAPPKKQWVGLTDQEINSVCYKRDWTAPWTNTTFARAIEEKLKEKNT